MTLYNSDIRNEGLFSTQRVQRDMTRMSATDSTYSTPSASAYNLVFDGYAASQRFRLPAPTGLLPGHSFYMVNDSTGVINTYNSDMTSLFNANPRSRTLFTLKDTTRNDWIFQSTVSFTGSTTSFFSQYNANASTGRYLVIYTEVGAASDAAPFVVVGDEAVYALTVGVGGGLSTGTVGVFKTTDLVNPLASVSLTNQLSNTISDLFVPVSTGDKLAVRVTAGTFAKPYVTVYLIGR